MIDDDDGEARGRQAGPEDFDEFFRRDYPRLVLHVWLRVGGQYAADAASAAMGKAYIGWSGIHDPGAWVRKVALHEARHAQQRDQERRARETTYLLRDRVPSPGPAELAEIGEEQAMVFKLIEQMPKQRRAVVALAFDGATAKEIAAELGIRQATVRSHLRHVRIALGHRAGRSAGGAS